MARFNYRTKQNLFCTALILACVLCASCFTPEPARTEFVLGTICSVNLYEGGSAKRYSRIFARLRELETILSANREDSALARLNDRAGNGPVPVPPELFEVLEAALHFARLSGGAFDPSVGPLVRLWGIGADNAAVPPPEAIAAALPLVDWRDIVLDHDGRRVTLQKPGMLLDLGAIAKGYAADEAVRIIREEGVKRAVIDLGGNVYAYGARKGSEGSKRAESWRIGIQDPRQERGGYLGLFRVVNRSVVTSGVYERFFEEGGKRYHHILAAGDAQSRSGPGYPVENGLLSVTIIAESSMTADALSTAAFALGGERGRALLESMGNVGGIFVFEDGTVTCTTAAEGLFELRNQAAYRNSNRNGE